MSPIDSEITRIGAEMSPIDRERAPIAREMTPDHGETRHGRRWPRRQTTPRLRSRTLERSRTSEEQVLRGVPNSRSSLRMRGAHERHCTRGTLPAFPPPRPGRWLGAGRSPRLHV
jgi:hypothetical protein